MKEFIISMACMFMAETSHCYPKTPNINIHPGHLCTIYDKDFDHYRYKENIPYCKRNVSVSTKNKICRMYGIYDRTGYTVDHIIPLSMGGSNSEKNLWCQSRKIYTGKLERWLYERLRDGKMRQAEALHLILSHKYDPTDKDHVPLPPRSDLESEEVYQPKEWTQRPE